MSSNTLSAQERADTTDAQPPTDSDSDTVADRLPAGADRLGIDAAGRIHYWDRAGEEMLVVEPTAALEARIETVDVAPGDEFRGYLDHAKEICGFDSLAYDDAWLTSGLAEAIDA